MALCHPIVEVDLGAIAQNYEMLNKCCPHYCGATVKANAYGLGAVKIARRLASNGCRQFFVASMAEGIDLRHNHIEADIFVFAGLSAEDTNSFIRHRLYPVLNSLTEIIQWGAVNPPQGAAIHIDTGMNRLGLDREDVAGLLNDVNLVQACGAGIIMTHLAVADSPADPRNRRQLERFREVRSHFPSLMTSIGNSAGVLNGAEYSGDLARPGIGLYGGNAYTDQKNPFLPVVRLVAPLLQIRKLSIGDCVGYAGAFRAEKEMIIGAVGIGYADGVSRNLSKDATLVVHGLRRQILGRISMDTIMVDLSGTALGDLQAGMPVEIIGEAGVDIFAEWADTNSYEILTGLGARIERRYHG